MVKTSKFFTRERRGGRDQLVIRIPLPARRLGRSDIRTATNYLLSFILLATGTGGVIYSLSTGTGSVPKSATVVTNTTPAPAAQQISGLPRSLPTHLDIPDIGVSTNLIQLGKNEDGSMETPRDYDIAGWYKYSPTPGEVGPAIITGHVDNYLGPAVFFNLKDLQPGQVIKVAREDGTTATFQVERVEMFDQNNFPTEKVYGNIDYPGLRLITCSGNYDVLSGRYSHNTVVYAAYVPQW